MQKSPIYKYLALTGLILWMSLIYYLSDQPGLSSGLSYDETLRTIAHFGVYGILALLTFATISLWTRGRNKKTWSYALSTFLFCFLYALSDEYHQSLVPDREASLEDILVDSAGIIAALIFLVLVRRYLLRRSEAGKGIK